LVQDHSQVHAHVTACVQEQKLHKTESVREMLSQPRKSVDAAQPFSAGVPEPGMYLVRYGHGGCTSATLSG